MKRLYKAFYKTVIYTKKNRFAIFLMIFLSLVFAAATALSGPRSGEPIVSETNQEQSPTIASANLEVSESQSPEESQQLSISAQEQSQTGDTTAELSSGSNSTPPKTSPDGTPQSFAVSGTSTITVPVGGKSTYGSIFTTDNSAVTWQIASSNAAWTGETPESYSNSSASMYVHKTTSDSAVLFQVEALPTAVVGEIHEFKVRITDPARGIDQVFTIQATVVAN